MPVDRPTTVNLRSVMEMLSPMSTPVSAERTSGMTTSPGFWIGLPSAICHGPARSSPGSSPTMKAKASWPPALITVFM